MKIELTNEEIKFLYEALENTYALVDDNISYNDCIIEKLKEKLFRTFTISSDERREIHSGRYEKKNNFTNKHLFLGSGLYSLNQCNILHKRLAYAIMELSGLQQGTGAYCESEEQWKHCQEQNKQAEEKIKKTLIDIISAFGMSLEDLK